MIVMCIYILAVMYSTHLVAILPMFRCVSKPGDQGPLAVLATCLRSVQREKPWKTCGKPVEKPWKSKASRETPWSFNPKCHEMP